MDNKTEYFDDDKPEDFKCDCVYPCDDYPECGGVRVTFPSSAGVEETQEDEAYSELYDLLDYEGREVDQYDYGLPWGDNKDAIISKMKNQFTITRKNK